MPTPPKSAETVPAARTIRAAPRGVAAPRPLSRSRPQAGEEKRKAEAAREAAVEEARKAKRVEIAKKRQEQAALDADAVRAPARAPPRDTLRSRRRVGTIRERAAPPTLRRRVGRSALPLKKCGREK